ncbi:MAG: hypothetical protein ACRDSR_17610 [Pseudonocardiaceae bacterium]
MTVPDDLLGRAKAAARIVSRLGVDDSTDEDGGGQLVGCEAGL